MKTLIGILFFLLAGLGPALAQTTAWVQIEAQPTLRDAQARARAYAEVFPDVNGFSQAGGWYAIVLGPFTAEGALARLRDLRRERLVPRDSYVTDGQLFRQQYWPIGPNGQVTPAQAPAQAPVVVEPQVEVIPEETPNQARRSEARLSREEKKLLQEALQWEGFYKSAIDGAFGRGTRASMAAWQDANGFQPTGVLTTRQREQLITTYRETFAALGMQTIQESTAGIQIDIPAAMVDFKRYEPPFAHFEGKGDNGVKVLLISQSGDQNTLFGLFDIMQTLEIVPMEGERQRKNNSFVLTGQNAQLHSYTYAALKDGAVKGFTLIWKPEDAKLMNRAAQMMQASMTPLRDAVLPDTAGDPNAAQSVDLLAGLEIRRPALSRSGFYVDAAGTVLTTTEVLQQCSRLTVAEDYEAELVARNEALGLAVLKPKAGLSPMGYAAFQTGVPRLNSEVAVAGYSYGGVLELPVLTYGRLADLKGLSGEDSLQRLSLQALPGDAGGPVFDGSGAVMGVLLPRTNGLRKLPGDVNFAAAVPAVAEFLSTHGVTMAASDAAAPMAPEDLTLKASDMTVLVSCWD